MGGRRRACGLRADLVPAQALAMDLEDQAGTRGNPPPRKPVVPFEELIDELHRDRADR